MTDPPAHGPDSSTPPEGPGEPKGTAKRREKGASRKRASKATASRPAAKPKARKRGGGVRHSDAHVEQLTAIVFERLVLGESRPSIIQFVTKVRKGTPELLTWTPSVRTVDEYIKRAMKKLRALAHVDRVQALAEARARFQLIIRKGNDAGDLGVVRLATRDLARIDALEPVHVRHSGSVITEHVGTVTHEHEHRAKPATIDEQATTIRDLFTAATARRAGGPVQPPASHASNN